MHSEKIHVIHVEIIILNTTMPVKLKTAFNYISVTVAYKPTLGNRIFSNEISGSCPMQNIDLLWLKHVHACVGARGHVCTCRQKILPDGRPLPCQKPPEATLLNVCSLCESQLESHWASKDSHPFTLYTVTTKTPNQSHAYLPVSFKTFSINININIWATMFHVKFQ